MLAIAVIPRIIHANLTLLFAREAAKTTTQLVLDTDTRLVTGRATRALVKWIRDADLARGAVWVGRAAASATDLVCRRCAAGCSYCCRRVNGFSGQTRNGDGWATLCIGK